MLQSLFWPKYSETEANMDEKFRICKVGGVRRAGIT
jgi:hypothetical protein